MSALATAGMEGGPWGGPGDAGRRGPAAPQPSAHWPTPPRTGRPCRVSLEIKTLDVDERAAASASHHRCRPEAHLAPQCSHGTRRAGPHAPKGLVDGEGAGRGTRTRARAGETRHGTAALRHGPHCTVEATPADRASRHGARQRSACGGFALRLAARPPDDACAQLTRPRCLCSCVVIEQYLPDPLLFHICRG